MAFYSLGEHVPSSVHCESPRAMGVDVAQLGSGSPLVSLIEPRDKGKTGFHEGGGVILVCLELGAGSQDIGVSVLKLSPG